MKTMMRIDKQVDEHGVCSYVCPKCGHRKPRSQFLAWALLSDGNGGKRYQWADRVTCNFCRGIVS